MTISIENAHPLFASIITGVDLSSAPDEKTVKVIEDSMAK